MKRIFGSLSRRSSSKLNTTPIYADDSPEGIIVKEVDAFCGSGGGPLNETNGQHGSNFVHLPAIVENAESSPSAAQAAALRIRKILSSELYLSDSYLQYNAIMLIRILVDNPGHTFTRNIDAKFVATVKTLLRQGKDTHMQHFLRETLDVLEDRRSWDEDLVLLLQMWKKEKGRSQRSNGKEPSPSTIQIPPEAHPTQLQLQQQQYPNYMIPQSRPPITTTNTLPPPDELAARVSEARTSAKLLIQLVQSTPPAEMHGNELIKEFSDRCRAASRSIHGYIESTNPAPDEHTLVTLIETNDELSVSLSKYSHAILEARKVCGNNNNNANVNNASNGNGNGTPSASGSASPARLPAHVPVPVPGPSSPSASESTSQYASSGAPPLPRRHTSQSQNQNHSQSPSRYSQTQASTSASMSAGSAASPSRGIPNPMTTATTTTTTNNDTGRYQYNSEDFQVLNPFADYRPENQRMNV